MTKHYNIAITVLDTIEMNEQDARSILEIYDDNYILTQEDWEEAAKKMIKFYLEEDYFIKEKSASINDIDWEEVEG